ncbi:heavy-metal-associated domain-containing protein [Candidatus Uhrbacteria bacterium]|nr:heavy-metal-associated domain-containing protein [Candidatus Uhrbacteria bacterium]
MITKFNITGMHCASCKALIEDACLDIPGVSSCRVDLATNVATVEHDADAALLKDEIAKLGYRAQETV